MWKNNPEFVYELQSFQKYSSVDIRGDLTFLHISAHLRPDPGVEGNSASINFDFRNRKFLQESCREALHKALDVWIDGTEDVDKEIAKLRAKQTEKE
jgi:hypothetical protein